MAEEKLRAFQVVTKPNLTYMVKAETWKVSDKDIAFIADGRAVAVFILTEFISLIENDSMIPPR